MKKVKVLYSMEHIDPDLIDEAETYKGARKKSAWIKWASIAACLCLAVAGAFVVPRLINRAKDDSEAVITQENTGDLAPMIYVNSSLYIISESQEVYLEEDKRLSFLGTIESKVDASTQPKEEFQSNDDIIGAATYSYEENLIVFYNDQCWVYRLYSDD